MIQNHLFIVRHGESENNLLRIDSAKLENKDKFGLTEKGIECAKAEANKYTDFDLVLSSPLRRARETAIIFAKASNCEVIENDLLNEVDHGDLELCSYDETDTFFKSHNDESVSFPNGESLLDAKQRTSAFLQQIDQEYSEKKILIVTHGHIVLFLLELLLPNFDRQAALENYDDSGSRQVVEVPLMDTNS